MTTPKDSAPKPSVEVKDLRTGDQTAMSLLDDETLDPNLHYRWVKESPNRIARHRMRQYRIVDKSEGVALAWAGDDAGDGRLRNGDTILMACPKEVFLARRKAAEDLAAHRTKRASASTRKEAKRRGLRSFVRDPDDPQGKSEED